MLKVNLRNFKTGHIEDFECFNHEIEKSYYKFYLTKHQIRYVPMYDFIVDITYPFELKFETYE